MICCYLHISTYRTQLKKKNDEFIYEHNIFRNGQDIAVTRKSFSLQLIDYEYLLLLQIHCRYAYMYIHFASFHSTGPRYR